MAGLLQDTGYAIAVDANQVAYVTGRTSSPDFPLQNAYQPTFGDSASVAAVQAVLGAGGNYIASVTDPYDCAQSCADAFLTIVDTTQSGAASLLSSTYLGGMGFDQGNAVTVDTTGAVYLTGQTEAPIVDGGAPFPNTNSSSFTQGNTFEGSTIGGTAFVMKFAQGATSPSYCFYFGAPPGASEGSGIAVDGNGDAFVVGNALYLPPLMNQWPDEFYNCGGGCGFVAEFNPNGGTLFSTFLGETPYSSADGITSVALDSSGNAYLGVLGTSEFLSSSTLVPTSSFGGAFVVKLSPANAAGMLPIPASLNIGSQPVGTTSGSLTVTLTNTGSAALNITAISVAGTNAADFTITNTCSTLPASVAASSGCGASVTFTPSTASAESASIIVSDNAVSTSQAITLTGTGTAAATTTTVAAPTITYGSAAGITVSVTSSQGTVTGNVSLSVDGGASLTQALSGGSTVFSISGLGGGSHSLSASYAAQGSFAASSATGALQVNQAQPTVSFTGAPASAAYQSMFAVVATTNASTTAVITASGACSIVGNSVTMTAATGNCSLTATWASDNNYLAASATQSTAATKANPTVTFTGAPANAVYESTFTIASTTNASTKPTYRGTSGICSVSGTTVTMKSGTGTCTLTASWAADSNYIAATGTQTTAAEMANSTVAISATTPNPSLTGQAVTVSVSVAPVAPATTNPTGNVTVSDELGDSCKATLSSGTGSCNISVSAAGAQTLTATYNGNTNFNTSASSGVSQTVDMASTTTTVASSPTTSVTGQPVTVKFKVAAVSPGKGTPTGTVTVSDGAGDMCSATVATGSCVITITAAGSKTLTGSYSGDSNFASSTSASVTQTVNEAKTKTTITAGSPSPSVAGQSVTFTFTVVPVSPGSGTPTGNVTLSDATGDTCTASVATGSCTITYATSGNKSMTASYAGDTNFASSKSSAVTQPVTDFSISAPDTITLKPGSQGTLTVTVAPKNSFAGTVALSCSVPPAGVITCSLSPASVTPSGSTSATSTVTVGVSPDLAINHTQATFALTFTGVYGSGAPASGGLTHSTTVTLTVD